MPTRRPPEITSLLLIERRRKCNLVTALTRFVFLLILASVEALAQSAILTCTRDASLAPETSRSELRLDAPILLDFQFSVTQNWRVKRAQLLLHVARGAAPDRVSVALATAKWTEIQPKLNTSRLRFLPHPVATHEEGWIRVDVAPALIELLAAGKGYGLVVRDFAGRGRALHSRESGQFAPYLVVEGSPR